MEILNEENKLNYQSGFMMASALRYAVDKINEKNDLNGYKMAYDVADCNNINAGKKAVLNSFLQKVPFIIGSYSSESSYINSILTGTFKTLMISYSATYVDFPKHGLSKGFMLRNVPSALTRMHVALKFLKRMEWNYISMVSSFSYNGEKDAAIFATYLHLFKACLAESKSLPSNPQKTDFENTIYSLDMDPKIKVIVLFTAKNDTRNFIKSLGQHNLTSRFYILCMYGCTNMAEVVDGIEQHAVGIISIKIPYKDNKGFKEYYLNQRLTSNSKLYFKKAWERFFQCNVLSRKTPKYPNNCTGDERLSNKHYDPETPIATVIDAAHSFHKISHHAISNICYYNPNSKFANGTNCTFNPIRHFANFNSRLYQFATTTRSISILKSGNIIPRTGFFQQIYNFYQYSKVNGTFKNVLIGNSEKVYQVGKIFKLIKNDFSITAKWFNETTGEHPMRSICSEVCPLGYIQEKDSHPQRKMCCWRCLKCPSNNIVRNNSCFPCKKTDKANILRSECSPLSKWFITFNGKVLPNCVAIACVVGLCCVACVVGFFIRYDKFRVIRASGRDLCYLILFGITMIFICPFLFLTKPTLPVCLFREGLPGVSFLCCYAPLFLKVHRIFRIFTHAKTSVSRPAMVSSRSLLLLSLGIIFVQILLVGVWFLSNVPEPIEDVSVNKEYITIHCAGAGSAVLMFLNLATSVFFMSACTVLAFKTRKYPKNYNEAKHIGITLYVTCIAWSIFLPAYFLIPEENFVREYFMSTICIVIGFITVSGLFGYKIRLLCNQNLLKAGNENLPTWYMSHSSYNGERSSQRSASTGHSLMSLG